MPLYDFWLNLIKIYFNKNQANFMPLYANIWVLSGLWLLDLNMCFLSLRIALLRSVCALFLDVFSQTPFDVVSIHT